MPITVLLAFGAGLLLGCLGVGLWARAGHRWALERGRLESQARVAELEMQLLLERDAAGERIAALQKAEERLAGTFRELSAQVFQANSETFLQLAEAKLAGRQETMTQALDPLAQTLAQLQTQVAAFDTARAASAGALDQQLLALARSQQGLQEETARLGNALRKPNVRGQWGEVQLRNVVEYAGMKEHVDFSTQVAMDVDDRRRRPDLVVNLPGDKCLAVDAKAPLQAYLEAIEAADEAVRAERLRAVAAQLRVKVLDLSDKKYFDGLPRSPDFVVLFLPMEALFSVALEQDPELLDFALAKGVIIATPTTLVAMLQAAAYGWSQDRVNANAEQIQATGKELYSRMFKLAEHVDELRKGLVGAVKGFNGFAGSLERNVLSKARELSGLGIRSSRKTKDGRELALPTAAPILEEPRGLAKLGVQGPEVLEADLVEDYSTE